MKKKLIWPETLLLLNLASSKISDDLRDELLEMRNDSSAYDFFDQRPLSQFGFLRKDHMQRSVRLDIKSLSSLSSLTYVNVDFLHLFKSKRK